MSGLLVASVMAQGHGAPGGSPPPPPEVTVITVEPKTVPVEADHLGIVQASRIVEVRARIRGFISERNFEEGTVVKAGDVIYRIESESFQADVAVEEARVAQSEAALKLAQREAERLEVLLADNAIAQNEYDRAEAALDEAVASLRLAKANLDKAKLELSYTEVRSPISGWIDKTRKEVGSLVDDGENSLLTSLTSVQPIYVTFALTEREYLGWRELISTGKVIIPKDGTVGYHVMLQNGTVLPEVGQMNFRDPIFDPQTGTTQIRVEFANTDERLKPGQFVKVFETGWLQPDAIAVPQKSVSQMPGGAVVTVIGEGDVAEYRSVKLGRWSGQNWIIESGLNAGDRVVVDGLMKAFPGMKVTPLPHGAPPAPESEVASKPAESSRS